MLQVKNIKVNYENNPIGITENPQFSWILESDNRNVRQSSYQLQISFEEAFKEPLFDSGKTDSEKSAQVRADAFFMKEAVKYYVRVKVWSFEEESEWSIPFFFVSGLIESTSWEGEFISAEREEDKDNSKGTYVRNTFCLKGKVKEAFAFTTALGLYEFYLNGKKVGADLLTPGWTSYHKNLLYQTYEVTDYLVDGENGIGASLCAGWYKGMMGLEHKRNLYGKQTAFLCQLIIHYEDGTRDSVYSDENWLGNDSPVEFAEIYDGEIYNAKREIQGWCEAGKGNETWRKVSKIVYDKSKLHPQGNCRVQLIEKIEPKNLILTPKKELVIDFGQNMSGIVEVTGRGKADDIIEIQCFETLDCNGNVYLDNLRGAKESLKYTFAENKEVTYAPSFTYMGFRYVKIVSFPGQPGLDNFKAYSIHSRMSPTGTFSCSNEAINQLQHNILWGMKSNFVDIPTDCPQRDERLGWTGDAQIFCRTATYLMNTYPFYRKWLTDLKEDQMPEGGVPHVIPDIITGKYKSGGLLEKGTHSAAAWADAAVIIPWNLYLSFGDKEILKRQYSSMKNWIDFMTAHAKDYIWNYKLQFGDWVALDAEEGSYFGATPNDLTATAYFAYSTGLFVKILKVLKKQEEIDVYQKLYEKIVEKFQRTFFETDGRMTVQTQTAHIIALYFDLAPKGQKKNVLNQLLKLLEKENGHLVTGFVGTPYFCHALSQNGALKEAYDLLLKDDFPSWLYQVKQGATTIWEHWDGIKPDGSMWSADMNSFNHYAYGAIGEWLYRVVAGIEVDEENPGYQHSILQPHFGGDLKYVQASYESVYGIISIRWEEEKDSRRVIVHIPVNTTATLKLNGNEVIEQDSLIFVKKDNSWEALAGSGDYEVTILK